MVFLWFPMVFLWISNGFPMDGFPMVFPWFSNGFPMVFKWICWDFPCHSLFYAWFPQGPHFRSIFTVLWSPLDPSGRLSDPFGTALGLPWAHLGPPWTLQTTPGTHLGRPLGHPWDPDRKTLKKGTSGFTQKASFLPRTNPVKKKTIMLVAIQSILAQLLQCFWMQKK